MFTIGIIQDHADADAQSNLRRAERLVRDAATRGAQIICLSELYRTIYFPQYKQRDAGGTWGSDVVLQTHTTDVWDVRDPSIAADQLGNVYVVWAEGLENLQGDPVCNILFLVREGAFWSGPAAITTYTAGIDPAPGAVAPSVAAHHRLFGTGSIGHVAWADHPAGQVRYRAIRYVPGSGMTLRGTVNLPLGSPDAPPSVATRCGDVHVAWARTADDANSYIRGVVRAANARRPGGDFGPRRSSSTDNFVNRLFSHAVRRDDWWGLRNHRWVWRPNRRLNGRMRFRLNCRGMFHN